MSNFLVKNWLILNALIPLITALTLILSKNVMRSRRNFRIASILLLLLIPFMPGIGSSYYLGGFEAPIGIEYKLDALNYTIIAYLNIILALFALSLPWLYSKLEDGIKENIKNYIYGIILIAHAGYIGIVSTGDLFNLYVFIEISSLATYGLISMGSGRHSIVAALDYLIVGTVSATFILVGIGMLYSITGTLNMEDMREMLKENFDSKLLISGTLIFVVGALLKLAIFPLHSWIIKTYRHTASYILIYVASLSVVIGFYTIMRFAYSTIGADIFALIGMNYILQILSIIAMLAGAYLGLQALNLRDIILYSSIVQMGYILMMFSVTNNISMIFQYLLADGFMKFIFFNYIALEEKGINNNTISYLTIYGVLSNIGLPITIGFFNKINLLSLLIENMYYASFAATIIATVISVNYNWRIINHIAAHMDSSESSVKYSASLFLTTILSLSLIFYDKI